MNVYDFDKTIYYPDAMFQFCCFCHWRHLTLWFRCLPKILLFAFLLVFKLSDEASLLKRIYAIAKYLKNPEKDIMKFWDSHEKRIRPWYLKIKQSTDLIITASPEYLVKPIADKLGVKVIGTNVDIKSGQVIGGIMKNQYKARFIMEKEMPIIENFYSDSITDTPIALLAERAYFVKKDKIMPWPHITDIKIKKIHPLKK